MTEEEIYREIEEAKHDPKISVLNNFWSFFPGGGLRFNCADNIYEYLLRGGKLSRYNIMQAHEDMIYFSAIDACIVSLGYDLVEVRDWTFYGELEDNHLDLIIKVFVHLINLGYERKRLQA